MKTIEEKNRMIAEFMGLKESSIHGEFWTHQKDGIGFGYLGKLHYQTSWDWLMPVVEKIEDIRFSNEDGTEMVSYHRFSFDMTSSLCAITDNEKNVLITEEDFGTKLRSTYEAVVQFIEWYNENK